MADQSPGVHATGECSSSRDRAESYEPQSSNDNDPTNQDALNSHSIFNDDPLAEGSDAQ